MNYVKEKGSITNKEYKKLTDVSKPTATRDLSELVEKDIFDIMGKGKRNICYFLTYKAKNEPKTKQMSQKWAKKEAKEEVQSIWQNKITRLLLKLHV